MRVTGGKAIEEAIKARGYQPHIKGRSQEAQEKKTLPASRPRRRALERTHSWFNRFRKLLVSFEKTEQSYLALLSLAAAIFGWRQTLSVYG
jgi:transposase